MESVTIPDSVVYIGKDPFGMCSSLTNVTIGSGLITNVNNLVVV